MDEAAERRVGTTLKDKWTLERLLGTGGMAAVYVGVHKIGRRDAIKILHSDIADLADVRARFEQEAHAANRLHHPGAVEIRDIDVAEDGAPFLVMELLEGESLAALARRLEGDLPYNDVLRYADELLDVLAAAHAQGIVHRDVKLDNLFVMNDGRLKVLDFGIARVRGTKLMRTRPGATLGTTPYMPPEQAQGLELDGRADLFAAGATMFRLLAKRRIHEASNEMELLRRMATEPAPSLAAVAPNVPRDACLVVDRALAFSRDRRYPDASTMQTDVRAVRAGQPPPYATSRLAAGDLPQANTASQRAFVDAPTAGATGLLAAAINANSEATRSEHAAPENAVPSTDSFERTKQTRQAPSLAAEAGARPRGATVVTAYAQEPPAASMPVFSSPSPSVGRPENTLRSLPTMAGGPAPPPSFGAPAIQVVDAPPLPSPPPRRESAAIALFLVGGLFLLIGAGVAFLFARKTTPEPTPMVEPQQPAAHGKPPPIRENKVPATPTSQPMFPITLPWDSPAPSGSPHAPPSSEPGPHGPTNHPKGH